MKDISTRAIVMWCYMGCLYLAIGGCMVIALIANQR